MLDDTKQLLIFVGGFLLFFAALFISTNYAESLTNECKVKGLQAGRPAIEIQAVCSRR